MTYDSDHNVGIKLDTPTACQEELERCSNGMAQLTQEFTSLLETLNRIEDYYEQIESIVARTVRQGDTKLTATEVKARVTEAMVEDENFAHIRSSVFDLRSSRETLERRLKTLEKRHSAAQSALKSHEADRWSG